MIKNIVITGATGFIGSNLVKRLVSEKYNLYLIVREESDLTCIKESIDSVNICVYKGETEELINIFKSIGKVDLVIHLASLFIAQHKQEQVTGLIDSNIKFGTQILEAMTYSGCKKIINTGSYWQHYKDEDYNPVCLYAATKEAYEMIMRYYYEAEDISCLTLELFDTYGETDTRKKIINLLKECAEYNLHLEMSPGEQYINLVYIDDVIEAYIRAIQILEKKNKINKKYVVSNKEEVTLMDLVGIVEKVYGKKLDINFGGRQYRSREVMKPWSKGIRLEGWEPQYTLREGLERMLFTKSI